MVRSGSTGTGADISKPYHSMYEAYPMLCEPADDLRCDFELRTDELASLTGLLRSLVPEDCMDLRAELLWVCDKIYHFNPTLRTGFSLTEQEVTRLLSLVEELQMQCKPDGFVLPAGTTAACAAHLLRVGAKDLVRLMYKHMEQGHSISRHAIDFANLLSAYFFMLALRLNAMAEVPEVHFASRVYQGAASEG